MNDDIEIGLEVPAANAFMSVIGACVEETLQRVGISAEQDRYNVQLALHEVAVNIVNHAYAGKANGRIHMLLTYLPRVRQLTLKFTDTGSEFDPSAVLPPDLAALPEHGLGLMLAEALMDRVEYSRVGTTNRWRLIKTFA